MTSLTAPCVLPDERCAVCGRLCPAGPQLPAGHRRCRAARRSLRAPSLHPGWLHADSSRQVMGLLFGGERWGVLAWHLGAQQHEELANRNQGWEKCKRLFSLVIASCIQCKTLGHHLQPHAGLWQSLGCRSPSLPPAQDVV